MKNGDLKIINWFKENIKYILLFAFFGIVLFVIPFWSGVVSDVKVLVFESLNDYKKHVLNSFLSVLETKLIFWFAPSIAIALMKFNYLFSEKKVNFYHALPLTRKNLFINNFLTGFFIFFISQFIIYLLFCIELGCCRCLSFDTLCKVFSVFLANIMSFIPIYSICIFVIMITGNMLIAVLGIFVFFIYFPLLGLCKTGWDITNYTPFYFQVKCDDLLSQFRRHSYMVDYGTSFNFGKFFIVVMVTSIVFIVASFELYKYRDLEKASEPIVFEIAKKIIRVMLSILFAVVICSFMSIRSDNNILMIVVFTLFAHSIMEMIVNKDIKSFYKDIVEKVVAVILAILVLWN